MDLRGGGESLLGKLTVRALRRGCLIEKPVCYEAEYVGGLFHWDCHIGFKKVLTPRGGWQHPILFCVVDDRSRLVCHMQWYLAETAKNVAHGLSQAFQQRGLPRSGLSDNGSAMTAAEIVEGLQRLGILHQTTLPHSAYQYVGFLDMWRRVDWG